jgi:hypothetical protein
MNKLIAVVLGATLLGAPAGAFAKPKGKPAAEAKKKKEAGPPPVGDKSANEGAQGRMNATEDAAKSADTPVMERPRP